MTAGAEHPRSALTAVLLVAAIVATGVACTSTDPDPAVVTTTSSMAAFAADEQAIRAAIGAVNSASAGAVAEQQSALRGLADPAGLAALDNCPPATTTLRFEPVWGGLRPTPDPGDEPGGDAAYALPTLIRVYTGDRITGTDLTTLELTVRGSAVYITPFCVG